LAEEEDKKRNATTRSALILRWGAVVETNLEQIVLQEGLKSNIGCEEEGERSILV
jgi:hypothetical protein